MVVYFQGSPPGDFHNRGRTATKFLLMKFSEFLSENSITGAALTNNANGINLFSGNDRVAAIMTRAETPAEEDLLQWCSDRMEHSCSVDRQGFITLTEPRKVTSLESLFAPAAPAKLKKAK